MCDDARTVIEWGYGDLELRVELEGAMTPEGIETMLHRTGREFSLRAHDIDHHHTDAELDAVDLETAPTDGDA